jgi:dTDP-4-amino-4,6-dideoxygalactose transaminase
MKRALTDLAILGGPPAFTQTLHVGRPNIGNRQRFFERLEETLEGRWLSNNGPCLQLFEERLRERLGARHCVSVANGTLGLMLAARALGLRGEVIMPSFTFVGTPHALLWQGVTPVFCDIDPETYQIDPCGVQPLITARTSGILGVHLFGRTCNAGALEAITRQHGLRLLFDGAHAVGCSLQGRPVGGRGDATVFSFHATKVINSFEGGAIATDDDDLAKELRLMRNFGFSDYDQVDYLGINAKLSEPAAAMGLTSLESLDEFVAVNQRNHESYRGVLADIPGIKLLGHDETEASNYHYVIAEVDGEEGGMSRDLLLAVLRAENILARRYFYPGCHRMEPYRSSPPWRDKRLPNTERVAAGVLALPTGTAIAPPDIEVIGSVIRVATTRGREVATRLAATSEATRQWTAYH